MKASLTKPTAKSPASASATNVYPPQSFAFRFSAFPPLLISSHFPSCIVVGLLALRG